MTTSVSLQSGYVIFRPEGRIDGINAKEIEGALLAALPEGPRGAILDLSKINYVSSAGLRLALVAAKKCQADSKNFRVCGMIEDVRLLFEITGFDKIIELRETVEAAIAD